MEEMQEGKLQERKLQERKLQEGNLQEGKLFDREFFAGLSRLSLMIKKKPQAGLSGGRKSAAKGSSVEFSDFREYLLGDDVRYIDWNAYGRLDKLFVKLFMEEKEGIFHILIDGSSSMLYGKDRKARQLAAMLAYMAIKNLDRVYVSFLYEDGKVQASRGLTGQRAFEELLLLLEGMPFYGKTALFDSIRKTPFHGRGMTMVISDFFDSGDKEELFRFLIFKKQEIALVHLLSEEEREPSFAGSSNLIDEETKKELRLTMTSRTKAAYQKSLGEMEEALGQLSSKYGAIYLPCVAEKEPERVLLELTGKRRK